MNKLSNNYNCGFTLIELLITVTIVGVLAAVALPVYQHYVGRTQVTEALTLMTSHKANVMDVYTSDGSLDNANNGSFGIPAVNQTQGKYTQQVEITKGNMLATMKLTNTNQGVQGKTLKLDPNIVNSVVVSWDCSVGTLPSYLAPKACR